MLAEPVDLVERVADGAPVHKDVEQAEDEHAREGGHAPHVQEVVQQGQVAEADHADQKV